MTAVTDDRQWWCHTGRGQCFKLPSVLWHCSFGDRSTASPL